jgi:hypothetical protein
MTPKRRMPPKYFICHLPPEDRAPNYVRLQVLPPLSIELGASGGGLSGKSTSFELDATEVKIEGHVVPEAVVQAAKKLAVGQAHWVDEEGNPAGFF